MDNDKEKSLKDILFMKTDAYRKERSRRDRKDAWTNGAYIALMALIIDSGLTEEFYAKYGRQERW